MSFDFDSFRGELNVPAFFQNRRYVRDFRKSHPEYFAPDGLILFCGPQGSGKTLSAVRYVSRLCSKYPSAIVVTNIKLNLPQSNSILPYEGLTALSEMDNGYSGIICLIDEIQTEFSSLESKKISPSVLSMISQQRKRRCHIVGTTQLFGRVSKPFREQISAAVDCKSLFADSVQRCSVIDLKTCIESNSGTLNGYQYRWHSTFIRSPEYFSMYDTYQRIYHVGYDFKS